MNKGRTCIVCGKNKAGACFSGGLACKECRAFMSSLSRDTLIELVTEVLKEIQGDVKNMCWRDREALRWWKYVRDLQANIPKEDMELLESIYSKL